MMMVVGLHYFNFGGIVTKQESGVNYLIASVLNVFFHVAVNCFFLNSGFFLKETKELSIKKIFIPAIKILVRVLVCTVLCLILYIFFGLISPSLDLLSGLFPLLNNSYWFVTVFVLISMLRPFFGLFIPRLQNKHLILLTAVLLFFDCVQPFFGNNAFNEIGNGFLHAFTMLVLGHLLSRIKDFKFKKIISICVYVVICIAVRLTPMTVGKLFAGFNYDYMLIYNNPLIITASAAFFTFFSSLNIRCTFFSKISPYVLSIYLVNDFSNVYSSPEIKATLLKATYENVMNCSNFYDSVFFFPHFLLCVFAFTVVGILVDFSLSNLFKIIVNNLFRKSKGQQCT